MTRSLWLAGGLFCVGLGILGLILPLMPGVLFLLIAAFCFARSKPEWEQRLLEHPHFGMHLRDWRERGAISRKGKRGALLGMALAGVLAIVLIGFPLVLISLTILAIVGSWIATRPE